MAKLKPGDALHKITSTEFNRHVDASDFFHARRELGEGGREPATPILSDRVKVKNISGSALRRGEVLEFTSFLLAEMQDEYPWFNGDTPDLTHVGWGLSRAPTPINAIEEMQIGGRCIGFVNFSDAGHKYAAPADGLRVLASACSGPIKVLAKASTGTGEKECWLQFVDECDHPALIISFTISFVAGSAATVTVTEFYHGRSPGSSTTVHDNDGCLSRAGAGTKGTAVWNACQNRYDILFLRIRVDLVGGVCLQEAVGSPAPDCCERQIQVVTPVEVLCAGADYEVEVTDCGGGGGDDGGESCCPDDEMPATFACRIIPQSSCAAQPDDFSLTLQPIFAYWQGGCLLNIGTACPTSGLNDDGQESIQVYLKCVTGSWSWEIHGIDLESITGSFDETSCDPPCFSKVGIDIGTPLCGTPCLIDLYIGDPTACEFPDGSGGGGGETGGECSDWLDGGDVPEGCSGGSLTEYTTAGEHTFTAPSNGLAYVSITGAGGGGAPSSGISNQVAGGGGGGGGKARLIAWPMGIGDTLCGYVPAGGTSGSPGGGSPPAPWSGAGEVKETNNAGPTLLRTSNGDCGHENLGGDGGEATIGTCLAAGENGSAGTISGGDGGDRAGAVVGHGTGGAMGANGGNASAYGCGGGGAGSNNGGAQKLGGSGLAGRFAVYFCPT